MSAITLCKGQVRAKVFWCTGRCSEVTTLHGCFCKVALLVHCWPGTLCHLVVLWLPGLAVVMAEQSCFSAPTALLVCVLTVEEELFPWAALLCSLQCGSSIRAFTIPAYSLHDGRGRRTRVGWRGRLRLGAGSRTDANPFNRKSKTDYWVTFENNSKKGWRMVRIGSVLRVFQR